MALSKAALAEAAIAKVLGDDANRISPAAWDRLVSMFAESPSQAVLTDPAPRQLGAATHAARLGGWSREELKQHLARLVDMAPPGSAPTPLDLALELLSGEVEAFVLFARTGHLDPPRPDGTHQIAILQARSKTAGVNAAIAKVIAGWRPTGER